MNKDPNNLSGRIMQNIEAVHRVGEQINFHIDAFLHENLDRVFGHEAVMLFVEQKKQIPDVDITIHHMGEFPNMIYDVSINFKNKTIARRRFKTIGSPRRLPVIKIEHMKPKILITGGCGFIGHHVVEHLLKNTNWDIVILDRLNYASKGFERLRDIEVFPDNEKRVSIFTYDFVNPIEEGLLQEIGQVDYILHMGAETHVDNSIKEPMKFVYNNVVGTGNILQFARIQTSLKRFIYFSTDEIFGPAPEGVAYKEWDRYCSTNPYSATKAAGEELAIAYANTYNIPVTITHTMNVFGERQHPEKFIPKVVKKVLKGETVDIHASKDKKQAGSRFWIHARNVAAAIHLLLEKEPLLNDYEKIGDKTHWLPVSKWNIVGEKELDNLELARAIHRILAEQKLADTELRYNMVDFHSSRPGHDLRYALDGTKLKAAGFELPMNFEETLEKTIKWMVAPVNNKWLK